MAKIHTNCPVEYTASVIANKWKFLIIRDYSQEQKDTMN